MSTSFTINKYGQDRIVMDWFGLQDPFDQYVPIKVTNNWSGALYFSYNLVSPPAWYSNASGAISGVLVNLFPLNAGGSDVFQVRWRVSISGNAIATASPNTDTLTLLITAYTSGLTSGILTTATIVLTNVLYNRYSGVIKVFGDNYAGDIPALTIITRSGGNLSPLSGQTQGYNYLISYFLSGWESDVGTGIGVNCANNIPSGTFTQTAAISWTGVAGVTQYAIWRSSGLTDLGVSQSNVLSGVMDLIGIVSGTSLTDTGLAALQTGMYRHRSFEGNSSVYGFDTTKFLSPPASHVINAATTTSHAYQISKNISGVSLLGPLYVTMHVRQGSDNAWLGLAQALPQVTVSGAVLADTTAFTFLTANSWVRFGFYLSGAGTSGIAMIQFSQIATASMNIDDIYIVANS